MRIGLAQLNPTVGDFAGNAEKILAAYRELTGRGADVVLAPELALPTCSANLARPPTV